MGVPKFFRYISERYPCLSEVVKEYQIPEFDNLYLDMNGIIHICSHPDDGDPHFRITEEKIFKDIFHYIEVLFRMIKPRNLFFMAIDGVAPRAKMNQQRGRRFRTVREAQGLEAKARERGEVLPTEARFDSNCITPGTVFMARLQEQLKYFIAYKISNDKSWQNCKVILSGHETPGEGEHKIMDYIRYMRAQPGYDPNTRHCLYGLDADLIMLGLCTHEPHFSLLREEVKFGKKSNKRKNIPEQVTFFLLHLSLMREYLELEFQPLKDNLTFEYNIEKIIDDWVLMGFLVGNDFIPNLPNMHITDGALPILYNTYMKVLPKLDGYINEEGTLNLERFEIFIQELGNIDIENFTEKYADLKWFESKTGRRLDDKLTKLKKLDMWEPENDLLLDEPLEPSNVNSDLADLIKATDDMVTDHRLEPLEPSKANPDLAALIKATEEMILEPSELGNSFDVEDNSYNSDDSLFNAEFIQHKTDYYRNKLEYEDVTPEVLRSQAEEYVRAIQWNLNYYYNGVCSWSWYYPHHYSPYVSDIKGFSNFKFSFELGTPFKPYEQLLAVLPAASKSLLPEPYQDLMSHENSLIKKYYPEDFKTDLNGKKQEWEAVVLIPFIDEDILLKAMESSNEKLTLEEKNRNTPKPMLVYTYTSENLGFCEAPDYFPSIEHLHAQCDQMSIEDIRLPKEKLVKGAYPGVKFDVYYPGFPTMKHLNYTGSLQKSKVKVFEQPSKGENMILKIIDECDYEEETLDAIAKQVLGKTVHVGWPHLVEALVVTVSNRQYRYHSTGEIGQYNVEENKGNVGSNWNGDKQGIVEHYQSRLGVDVGFTNVLLHVKVMVGRKYMFSSQGRITLEKQWANTVSAYPLQTIVHDITVYEDDHTAYKHVSQVFPATSNCFVLCNPGYGSMAEILESSDFLKEGRIKISLKNVREPELTAAMEVENNITVRYMNVHVASVKLGIPKGLFSRITGSIYIAPGSRTAMASEDLPKVNIGLNLKFTKRNEEVSGYSKRENGTWLYSDKAVQLVKAYKEKFPFIFNYLAHNVGNDVFYEEEIFSDGNAKEILRDITSWIKQQPFYNMERQVCGSLVLDPETIKTLEEVIDEYNKKDCKVKQTILRIKPHLLYKPDLQMGNLMPDPGTTFELYDRIVNVREGHSVPFGLKGTIIGIHKPSSAKDSETLYDVVFDKEFPGGLSLNCSANRGYRMPRPAIINISHGQRIYELRKRKTGQLLNLQNAQNHANSKNGYMNVAAFPPNSANYSPGQFPPHGPPYSNWGYGYNYPVQPTSAPVLPNQYNNYNSGYSPRIYNGVYSHPVNSNNPGPNTFVPYNKSVNFPCSVVPLKYGSPTIQRNASNMPIQGAGGNMEHSLHQKNVMNNEPTIPRSTNEFPKVDSEMLKKMLKINDNSSNTNSSIDQNASQAIEPEKKGNSVPLTVEDIFKHARDKEQQKQQQPLHVYNTALLQKEFQARDFGCPIYQYITVNKKYMAKIVLPNGTEVIGDVSKSKEDAAENVAMKTCAILKTLNAELVPIKPPEPPKKWSSALMQGQTEVSPQTPQINWRERNTTATQDNWRTDKKPDKHDKLTKVNVDHIYKHLNLPNKLSVTDSNEDKSDNTKMETQKETATNSLAGNNAFVPLQAFKQQHKQRSALANISDVASSSKKNGTKQHEPSKSAVKQKEQVETLKPEVSNKKSSLKPRRERKIRIAANFPTAMNNV